jgi:hypothetical protein
MNGRTIPLVRPPPSPQSKNATSPRFVRMELQSMPSLYPSPQSARADSTKPREVVSSRRPVRSPSTPRNLHSAPSASDPTTSIFPAFPQRRRLRPPLERGNQSPQPDVLNKEEILRLHRYWNSLAAPTLVPKYAHPMVQSHEMKTACPGHSSACLFCDVVGPGWH